jgi:dihydropteroate synthase
MGILNITPDSFSDGGLRLDPERAVADGLEMVEDGADILERLAARTRVPVSIDTYKAVVAEEAVARGAVMINDVSGLQYDPDLGHVAARTGAALVLMHTRGRSREMYERATYADLCAEVAAELADAVSRALRAGVSRDAIVLDPGFGFAKQARHSFELLAHLDRLAALDRPILSGPSRKSFLKAALGERLPPDREWGTAAAVAASVLLGAHIVRVHGVREMVDVVRVADRVRAARSG